MPLCKHSLHVRASYLTYRGTTYRFVVDSVDVSPWLELVHMALLTAIAFILQKEKFETARFELHQLLAQPSLSGVPLLVVSLPN